MKDTNIIVRTSTDLRASFKEHAAQSGKTMSDLIREYMESTAGKNA